MNKDQIFRSNFFANGRLKLHYLTGGTNIKEPLLLLHGIGDSAWIWENLAKSAMDTHYVIALDQRGHGLSDWTDPPAYKCEDYISDIHALTEHLKLRKMVIVGHSMGALHGTRFATLFPEKVKALVHTDIEPAPPVWNKRYLEKLYLSLTQSFSSIEEYVNILKKNSTYAEKESLSRFALHNLKKTEDGSFCLCFHREVLRNFDNYDLRPYLKYIECPTMIVRGEESRVLTREGAFKMSTLIKNCRIHEISRAAHPVMTDNPKEFTKAVMDFLSQKKCTENGNM
ncbi:MAG: alpha/beta hydrolase [Syntrophales bacterium]|nr:alpha/beta hydrolase [Syntrophales bacterium]